MTYAANTSISVDRSRSEIEKMLSRAGASGFGFYTDAGNKLASIAFVYSGLHVRMDIPIPDREDPEFTTTSGRGLRRSTSQAENAFEDEVRRRWRCLCLIVKAKMVAVADGVTTFEKEFLPYIVTSDGGTVGERLMPLVEKARGKSGLVMPALTDGRG